MKRFDLIRVNAGDYHHDHSMEECADGEWVRFEELPSPNPHEGERSELFERHTKAVAEFLSELYAILVDPLCDEVIPTEEMKMRLLNAAKSAREFAHSADAGGAEPAIESMTEAEMDSELRQYGIDPGKLMTSAFQKLCEAMKNKTKECASEFQRGYAAGAASEAEQRKLAEELSAQRDEAVKLLTASSHALRSYQYGNDSTELAECIAKHIDKFLSTIK